MGIAVFVILRVQIFQNGNFLMSNDGEGREDTDIAILSFSKFKSLKYDNSPAFGGRRDLKTHENSYLVISSKW